jgi:hypothetical protein
MKNTKSIGGYFELELHEAKEFHSDAIPLNTARNALEYVLIVRKIKKIFLPYFTCEVLLEPMYKLKIPFQFYSIDENLEPIFDFTGLKDDDAFLYTNYFGLKDWYIQKLSTICKQLIVDNAQAFFSKPLKSVPTFYSVRKFFGVSDGAYLYNNEKLEIPLKQDVSIDRMSHLLIRRDVSPEAGYMSFSSNDKSLENQQIKSMSKITQSILRTIDYEVTANKRKENFLFLDKILKKSNQLSFNFDLNSVPMVYPYWNKNRSLKKVLLENKIYTPTYWHNVLEWCAKDTIEYQLTSEVIYLPIDQRYDLADMNRIIKKINDSEC